jgi:hypothetical protein
MFICSVMQTYECNTKSSGVTGSDLPTTPSEVPTEYSSSVICAFLLFHLSLLKFIPHVYLFQNLHLFHQISLSTISWTTFHVSSKLTTLLTFSDDYSQIQSPSLTNRTYSSPFSYVSATSFQEQQPSFELFHLSHFSFGTPPYLPENIPWTNS